MEMISGQIHVLGACGRIQGSQHASDAIDVLHTQGPGPSSLEIGTKLLAAECSDHAEEDVGRETWRQASLDVSTRSQDKSCGAWRYPGFCRRSGRSVSSFSFFSPQRLTPPTSRPKRSRRRPSVWSTTSSSVAGCA